MSADCTESGWLDWMAFNRFNLLMLSADEDDFRRYHYKEGYFSYRDNGFGPVCTTEDSLLSELETLFESGMTVPSEYAKRIDGFFQLHDAKNCERTYDAIINL